MIIIILDEVNLTLEKGKIYGIKGESGSGKSTFLNILCGLIKPQGGKFTLIKSYWNLIMIIGYLILLMYSQKFLLLNDTFLNNITFEYNSKNIDEKFEFSIKKSKIKELINSLENGRDTIIGDRGAFISSGQSQRINIARVLYSNRELLIFDEATNALDKNIEKEIFQNIKDLNITNKNKKLIIIVSHKSENLKFCDDVLEVKDKKIVKI